MADTDESETDSIRRLSEAAEKLGSLPDAIERVMSASAAQKSGTFSTLDDIWFADTLEELKKQTLLQEAANKMFEPLKALAGGNGGGNAPASPTGPPATSPEPGGGEEKPKPGFLRRMFEQSRYGAAYDRWQEKARDLFGIDAKPAGGGEGKPSPSAPKVGAKPPVPAGGGASKIGGAAEALGGGGAAGMAGAAGGLAGMATKLAGPVGVAIEAGKALNEFRKAIEQSTTQQLESYRKLGEVSGAMSVVMQNRDVRDMLRDMKKGDALAPSANKLAESESKRKDAWAPIETAIDKATNEVLTLLNDVITEVLKPIGDGLEVITDAAKVVYKWITLKEWKEKPVGPNGLEGAIIGPGGILNEAAAAEARARGLLANLRAADARVGGGAAPGGLPAARPGRLP